MKPHFIEPEKVKTLNSLPTPSFVIDEGRLITNLQLLNRIEHETGCKILLAQKCFSTFALYPLIGQYISGTTASGIYEAKLGFEEMHKENHVFAPAFKPQDISELDQICDHIVFNSWNQYRLHSPNIHKASIGIRVNPQFSTQDHAIYDPCATGSRLGVTIDQMPETLPDNIEGLHFHTLCEQGFEDLESTFNAFEEKFSKYIPHIKWLNLGGGHHITHPEYNVEGLIAFLKRIHQKYGVQIYLEPGEGVVLNCGYMVTEVMDKVRNGLEILILDFSAACHCADIIEMPLMPPIFNAEDNADGKYVYRLSSMTCLAGDVIGDYSFNNPVNIGDKIIIEDMALYSMVKTNTFNGMPLPDIFLLKSDGSVNLIKRFGYQDFKQRLG